jgi:alpha-mannosidase
VRLGLAKAQFAAPRVANPCAAGTRPFAWIAGARWRVCASRAGAINVWRDGRNFLSGRDRLRLRLMEDPWGAWGGMHEEPASWRHDRLREEWELARHAVLESGPERSRLWTRWEGRRSWVELTFDISRGAPAITVHGRMLWNERSARLQLVLPSSGPAVCDVPGGRAVRRDRGQVPIGRWFCRTTREGTPIGVASDVLSDADFLPGETRLTLARASRYANDVAAAPAEQPWLPAVDCGELKFTLALFGAGCVPDAIAGDLQQPPFILHIPPRKGSLPAVGSLARLTPRGLRLLAVTRVKGTGLRVRVQNRAIRTVKANFEFAGLVFPLGKIAPGEIATKVCACRNFSGR